MYVRSVVGGATLNSGTFAATSGHITTTTEGASIPRPALVTTPRFGTTLHHASPSALVVAGTQNAVPTMATPRGDEDGNGASQMSEKMLRFRKLLAQTAVDPPVTAPHIDASTTRGETRVTVAHRPTKPAMFSKPPQRQKERSATSEESDQEESDVDATTTSTTGSTSDWGEDDQQPAAATRASGGDQGATTATRHPHATARTAASDRFAAAPGSRADHENTIDIVSAYFNSRQSRRKLAGAAQPDCIPAPLPASSTHCSKRRDSGFSAPTPKSTMVDQGSPATADDMIRRLFTQGVVIQDERPLHHHPTAGPGGLLGMNAGPTSRTTPVPSECRPPPPPLSRPHFELFGTGHHYRRFFSLPRVCLQAAIAAESGTPSHGWLRRALRAALSLPAQRAEAPKTTSHSPPPPQRTAAAAPSSAVAAHPHYACSGCRAPLFAVSAKLPLCCGYATFGTHRRGALLYAASMGPIAEHSGDVWPHIGGAEAAQHVAVSCTCCQRGVGVVINASAFVAGRATTTRRVNRGTVEGDLGTDDAIMSWVPRRTAAATSSGDAVLSWPEVLRSTDMCRQTPAAWELSHAEAAELQVAVQDGLVPSTSELFVVAVASAAIELVTDGLLEECHSTPTAGNPTGGVSLPTDVVSAVADAAADPTARQASSTSDQQRAELAALWAVHSLGGMRNPALRRLCGAQSGGSGGDPSHRAAVVRSLCAVAWATAVDDVPVAGDSAVDAAEMAQAAAGRKNNFQEPSGPSSNDTPLTGRLRPARRGSV